MGALSAPRCRRSATSLAAIAVVLSTLRWSTSAALAATAATAEPQVEVLVTREQGISAESGLAGDYGLGQAVASTSQVPSLALQAGDLLEQGPSCHLQGTVDECCNCTYSAVDDLNQNVVNPVLQQLVTTAFFRYFKVNIYCDCPLWPEDSMCSLRACSVCECKESEVPQPWLAMEGGRNGSCDSTQCAAEIDSRVDSHVDPAMRSKLLMLKAWRGFNNPWMAEGEQDEDFMYINLLVNPERYTGYQGEHAHRIWNAIYSQSCFHDIDCTERRVFYRLISGMHASISAHIGQHYLLDEERGMWGPNITDFEQRLGTPDVRYRVQNLYFAYLFVLRAVMKAGPLLARVQYLTGEAEEDALAASLVKQLVTHPRLREACPMPFDEGRLWKGDNGPALRQELQGAFRHITRVMDCVGCEKCKLWGKLQTLGIATALKILFSAPDCGGEPPGSDSPGAELVLERNEVIALINLLERFSNSIEYYRALSAQLHMSRASMPVVAQQEAVF